MRNCVIWCKGKGFLTTSHGFSQEYPNAWLMSEGQADRELALVEQTGYDPDDPFMVIRDYGTDNELILFVQEDPDSRD